MTLILYLFLNVLLKNYKSIIVKNVAHSASTFNVSHVNSGKNTDITSSFEDLKEFKFSL